MTDQMDDLMKAAEACVAEATPETLEPGKLRLVKGEFSSLEDALREQVRQQQHDMEKLEAKIELYRRIHLELDGIIAGQRDTIEDYRSQLETPINFDDDE